MPALPTLPVTRVTSLLVALLATTLAPRPLCGADPQAVDPQAVESTELGNTVNVHRCGSVFLAGQPTAADIARLQDAGIQRVISLRTDGEIDWDEAQVVQKADIDFVSIPFRSNDSLTDEVIDSIRQLLRQAEEKPTMLHCGSANRVGAVWLAYRVLDQGVPLEQAQREAKEVGLRNEAYEQKVVEYINQRKQSAEAEESDSINPGINSNFLDPNLDVQQWVERFEVESREVFAARTQVLQACQLHSGMRVADVGAGTGLYTQLFSRAVGPDGWVFAVDIAPRFLQHINQQSSEYDEHNVSCVLASDRQIHLPPSSVDLVFVCDTYHHFEYPRSTLASIHQALRPGGQLVVIDFERVEGKSREWVLSHVRAGKGEVQAEIEGAGFKLAEEVDVDGLQENYFLRFRKPQP